MFGRKLNWIFSYCFSIHDTVTHFHEWKRFHPMADATWQRMNVDFPAHIVKVNCWNQTMHGIKPKLFTSTFAVWSTCVHLNSGMISTFHISTLRHNCHKQNQYWYYTNNEIKMLFYSFQRYQYLPLFECLNIKMFEKKNYGGVKSLKWYLRGFHDQYFSFAQLQLKNTRWRINARLPHYFGFCLTTRNVPFFNSLFIKM